MVALAHLHIEAENGPLSNECVDRGIISFLSLIEWVEQLPYRRNSDRSNFQLVLEEEYGACSTKNALIKAVALENGWNHVKLYLGLFQLSEKTHVGIGSVLQQYGLESIPEAHVYLKINGELRDVTGLESAGESFDKSLLDEVEISPDQIGEFKVEWHQNALKNVAEKSDFSFDELWRIREECIATLS